MKHATHPDVGQVPNPLDVYKMWGIEAPSFEFAEKALGAWLDGTKKLQVEATEFFNARAGKDMAALSELIHCRTPAEALEMQARYAGEVMSDYVAGSQRMFALMSATAQHGAEARE
jgi:hypothetical protein